MKLVKTYRKQYFNKFHVDIEQEGRKISAWIWHDEYAVKDYMFGSLTDTTGRKAVEDTFNIIDSTIYQYIQFYFEDHMQNDFTSETQRVEMLLAKFDKLGLLAETE